MSVALFPKIREALETVFPAVSIGLTDVAELHLALTERRERPVRTPELRTALRDAYDHLLAEHDKNTIPVRAVILVALALLSERHGPKHAPKAAKPAETPDSNPDAAPSGDVS